jgi:methyltransferase (TIGR00027 family)
MKTGKASRTAQYMALFRALETNRDPGDRLFTDPYARHFLDSGLKLATMAFKIPLFRKFIGRTINKKIPGAFSSGLARTKYIDDLVQKTINNGSRQVVILGAGFDTRALRLDFLRSVPVIEIDHPDTSRFKIETFKKKFGNLPDNIAYYQIDFNKQSLDGLAKLHHFDFTKPTTIIWEGVTNYLTSEAVGLTFSFIARFPKGSHVIFTYVHQHVLDKPGLFEGGEKLLSDLENIEERWTFGLLPEQLPEYLKKFGFTLREDLGATDYRNKYIPGRSEKGYEFYRVAMAEK